MRYRCYRCRDTRPGRAGEFHEFESDRHFCTRCGHVASELADVHLLMPCTGGPIWDGSGGRWQVGCQPKRDVLARNEADQFSASHDARAVTCPSCRGLPAYKEQAKMWAQWDREFRARYEFDRECCG
jgi:hypothetical protein